MNPGKKSVALAAVLLATLPACRKPAEEPVKYSAKDTQLVPALSADTPDYPMSPNDNLAHLGRVLFYDQELSINKNVSCGSCHKQSKAFTDDRRFSEGTDGVLTKRNTPGIFARFGRLFWDGRSFSFDDLALRPVREKHEMGISDIGRLVARISTIDYYQPLIERAFPNRDKLDSFMIKNALAEFMRNFTFADHKFNQSINGIAVLSPQEEYGRQLFFGKAKCSECHHVMPMNGSAGYGSTDESHNIGLDVVDADKGVGAVTRQANEDGAFMMPVLINVELTAPYMHDGRFATLEEVVDHYSEKIKPNPNLDQRLKNYDGTPIKLNLTAEEKKSLVAFLKTLTDRNLLEDAKFSNPFVPRTM